MVSAAKDVRWAGDIESFFEKTTNFPRPPDSIAPGFVFWPKNADVGSRIRRTVARQSRRTLNAFLLELARPSAGGERVSLVPSPARTPPPGDDAWVPQAGLAKSAKGSPRRTPARNRRKNLNDKTILAQGNKFTTTGAPACHGAAGKGDGPAAAALNPSPPISPTRISCRPCRVRLPILCYLRGRERHPDAAVKAPVDDAFGRY